MEDAIPSDLTALVCHWTRLGRFRPCIGEGPLNTVGVKDVARLISRIRNRQFGALVTTSVVARQAYQEVRADDHPIVIISGRDIAEILISRGFQSCELVRGLLKDKFPIALRPVDIPSRTA